MSLVLGRLIASTVDVTGREKLKGRVKTTGEVPAIFPKGAVARVKVQGLMEMPVKRTDVEKLEPQERGFLFTKFRFTSDVRNPRVEAERHRAKRRKARMKARKSARKTYRKR